MIAEDLDARGLPVRTYAPLDGLLEPWLSHLLVEPADISFVVDIFRKCILAKVVPLLVCIDEQSVELGKLVDRRLAVRRRADTVRKALMKLLVMPSGTRLRRALKPSLRKLRTGDGPCKTSFSLRSSFVTPKSFFDCVVGGTGAF